ncbi:hypothetical protein Suden_1469 [Sulfurimonas denitrificans DSM 1251]|jgi:hypothetical protein|uniref:Uncharacterized protein n=1 Tax=Sulfurimonas denitrificans (strain ATCC 33889 / DSM 1251) TaxID=326298 RepID=Q30QI5_SULDN|nr:hypothetical protein [Sulfurimonas denitrificans]ABB44746.1 hypothetical protein Suden_1469 [Sulfurimonas denitrificans DSM 1251]MDD3443018.1 hypothetical protein [Sulfurimonas denitrificans]
MSKAFQALLTGMFITFILDFFLFLGVLLHYIEFYKIDLYYNILFVDNQNWYLFFSLSIIFGWMVIYIKNYKVSLIPIVIISIFTFVTLFEDFGYMVGEMMFMKENITLRSAKFTYIGNIIYEGREEITFYRSDISKIVTLKKKDLI